MSDHAQKLALAMAELLANFTQLRDEVEKMRRELEDTRDIFRSCACFGVVDYVEVP